ncbi:MAG: RNA polymerase sigma factor [Chloroflexota bacterium]
MDTENEAHQQFETLFRRYEQPICSYLARLTGNQGRAQELTQETFLRAYVCMSRQALEPGAGWENPRAWLYSVASRLAIDAHRRRKLIEWLPLLGTEPNPGSNPETVVAKQLAVQEALDALAPKYRIPLLLYVHEGWKVQEIAEMLDLSVSAVKMRLCRAREQFREAYEQGETDDKV